MVNQHANRALMRQTWRFVSHAAAAAAATGLETWIEVAKGNKEVPPDSLKEMEGGEEMTTTELRIRSVP